MTTGLIGKMSQWWNQTPDEDLHIATAMAFEASIRRRANRCRRLSWVFLVAVIAAIVFSVVIVSKILTRVSGVEAGLLANYAGKLREGIEKIELQQSEIKPNIDASILEVMQYLTGAGVAWEDLTVDVFRDGYVIDLEVTLARPIHEGRL